MSNVTKYVGSTLALEDLVMNPTPDPYLTILVTSVMFVWGMRLALYLFLYSPQITIPPILTSDFINQVNNLNIFTPEFLFGLRPGGINPFTPTLMAQLRAEFALGDQILYDTGIHSILGTIRPTTEVLIRELILIAPTF
jgi:hypothetical protein